MRVSLRPEQNKIGVVGGMRGRVRLASHFSVNRIGRRNLGKDGRIKGMRDWRERKVFSRITPEIWRCQLWCNVR